MAEVLRRLTDAGTTVLAKYLELLRTEPAREPPRHLLGHADLTEALDVEIHLELPSLKDRFEVGEWLVETLSPLDRRKITYDSGMWNWLALSLFDSICPPDDGGRRKVLRNELYLLPASYDYMRYYKHLVRTPWLAVLEHGQNARVLFKNARGIRSDIEETLAASQQVFGDRTILEAASKLYFDEQNERPKPGASGKGAGSPRRLTAIVQQLALTYDIQSCSADQFLQMLPDEFNRFRLAST